jgi:hypothetical protein
VIVNVAAELTFVVRLEGCEEIDGGVITTNVAAVLVTLPAAFVTTTA